MKNIFHCQISEKENNWFNYWKFHWFRFREYDGKKMANVRFQMFYSQNLLHKKIGIIKNSVDSAILLSFNKFHDDLHLVYDLSI